MGSSSVVPRNGGVEEVAELRAAIERRLAILLPADGNGCLPLGHALAVSTLSQGRRVRPLLLVLVAKDLGGRLPGLLDLGCAVEMVHCASLALDDLPCMDNATLRRGEPALHRRVGEDVATLSAVALIARAFAVLAAADVNPTIRATLVEHLSAAIGTMGLVRGQFEDLHESCRSRPQDEIALTNHFKTGVLFAAAMQMVGLAVGASAEQAAALERFSYDLGQAFQLCDDLRDGDAGFGKDIGQDRDKVTLVTLLGEEGARAQLARHARDATDSLIAVVGASAPAVAFVRELFREFESVCAK